LHCFATVLAIPCTSAGKSLNVYDFLLLGLRVAFSVIDVGRACGVGFSSTSLNRYENCFLTLASARAKPSLIGNPSRSAR